MSSMVRVPLKSRPMDAVSPETRSQVTLEGEGPEGFVTMLGLADPEGQELSTGWYKRQLYTLPTDWKVKAPPSMRWTVEWVLLFDEHETELDRMRLDSRCVLRGGYTFSLTLLF